MKIKSSIACIIMLLLFFIFDEGSATAMIGTTKNEAPQPSQWIEVPNWLAGTWQRKLQTFLDCTDCTTGQRSVKEPVNVSVSLVRVIGTQQDSSGKIWHYTATPYVRNVETNDYYEMQTIVQTMVLNSTNERLTLRTAGKVNRKFKDSEQTLDGFYEITDVTYSPLNEGVVKVEMLVRDFDANGNPLYVSRSVSVDRRVRPFAVINYDERGNLQQKFSQFLLEKR